MNAIVQETEGRMKKSLEALRSEFSRMRTARAHPSLLETVHVSHYGSEMPLNQLASVAVSDARTLVVTAWDKSATPAIEKAIMQAELGLNPVTAGDVIRVPIPPLTEERRKEMLKIARGNAENARVSVRNVRRDANKKIKDKLKAKQISEDEDRRLEDAIQKLTNRYVSEVDAALVAKEKDLMAV